MAQRRSAMPAFSAAGGVLVRLSTNYIARRGVGRGVRVPALANAQRCAPRACATAAASPSPLDTDTAPAAAPAAVAAVRPVRRGDVVDVRVHGLDYGGGGIAELDQLAGERDRADAALRVHTPKGAMPGDRVRVVLTKVRRPRSLDGLEVVAEDGDPSSPVVGPVAEALFVERIERSPQAIVPPCKHFGNAHLGGGSCGGCVTMDMVYADQIAEKKRQIERLFSNLQNKPRPVTIDPFVLCDRLFAYRNKMEFSFGRKWHLADPKAKKEPMSLVPYGSNRSRKRKSRRPSSTNPGSPPNEHRQEQDRFSAPAEEGARREFALGLHVPARYDRIVEIKDCHVQEPVGNDILEYIRSRYEYMRLEPYDSVNNSGYLRNVGIRTAFNADEKLEILVNLMTGLCEIPGRLVPLAEELRAKFPNIVSIVQNMPSSASNVAMDPSRQRLLSGDRPYLEQKLCGLVFEISANSFFQTNSYQAEKLYHETRLVAQLRPDDLVLDLFCGTGSIGLTMAQHCRKVVGIELVPDAIADAKRNAARNGITNAEFAVGDLVRLKDSPIPILGNEQPDVIVVDPPRAGLHKDVVKFLSKTMARRIVYVSCNPATQVKDLAYLLKLAPSQFKIDCVRPVDMFPHTPHIESIVGISRSTRYAERL